MRAALCRAYGPPEVVQVEEIPAPSLGPGQIRVRVQAASVNFPDVLLVANKYQIPVPIPFVPGSEFAGEITEVADDVHGLEPGERVFGSTFVGAFAQEVVVAARAVSPIPSSVGEKVAAAFGVAHRTAYHSLKSVAQLRRGEDLVVLGAGGGVGLATVELGKLMGARVTAVASSEEKLEVAKSKGAELLVDYRERDLRESLRELLPEGADVVIDPVGGQLSEPSLRALRWGGRFVSIGYATGEIPRIPLNLVMLKGVHVLGFEFRGFATHAPQEIRSNERELMDLLASGRVAPHIGATFTLDEAPAALRWVADGRAIGKVLVVPG